MSWSLVDLDPSSALCTRSGLCSLRKDPVWQGHPGASSTVLREGKGSVLDAEPIYPGAPLQPVPGTLNLTLHPPPRAQDPVRRLLAQ